MDIFRTYTIRSLKKNKTRTIVTIIGIILSVAMFTATLEAFVTVQSYLINYAEMYNGKYHVGFCDVEYKDISKIADDDRVEKYTYVQEIGYAEIGSSNEYKPYLYIAGVPTDFTEIMPIHLTQGRLPENSNELVVSDHLYSNGGVELELGQKITLDVGQRQWAELVNISEEEYKELDGDSWAKLTQEYPLRKTEGEAATEHLVNTKKKTYTVVGFCVRPDETSIEPHSAPGYTAYTINEEANTRPTCVYTIISKPSDYSRFNIDIVKLLRVNSNINHDLLMFSFQSFDSAFPGLAIGLLSVLIGLIVFGSVSLIYNSFSISVSERTKQFGILKSIGATKRLIRKSVLYEAAVLCVIGIPIGLISGCLGIGVTFYFLNDTISTYLASLTDLKMQFVFSPPAILAASIISFVTVIISAYIPAKKAIKINPIESVRQSDEIKIKRRSVRVSPLTQKLFGFEATLSSKNFKRNKRKYRTTVFSLFVSVVLFISASSLSTYFTDIVEIQSQDRAYDVEVAIHNFRDMDIDGSAEITHEALKKLYDGIKAMESVDDMAFVQSKDSEYLISAEFFSEEYKNMHKRESPELEKNTDGYGTFVYNFVDDEAFRKLLKEEGISEKDYFDKNNPKALLYDKTTYIYQNNNKETVYSVSFLDKNMFPGQLQVSEVMPCFTIDDTKYICFGQEEKDGKIVYKYDIGRNEGDEIDPATAIYLSEEEAKKTSTVNIGAVVSERPYFVSHFVNFIYPESMMASILTDEALQTRAYIITDEHRKVTSDISGLLRDIFKGANNVSVYNYAEEIESIRALVTIARVLAYGFIVLISLIAAANVFNTISTNISLRKREFATLRSVGLTSKGMRKMMFFESLLYGIKSLLFSLPVSLGMTYLIYFIASDSGYNMEFYIPWGVFITAIASVFIIVALSMVYSIKKIKKENTIDSLRNENI